MNRQEILDKAGSIIAGERQGQYGRPEDSFSRIAQLWTGYLGKDISSYDVANMMILMKVARNANGVYKDDNWIDICGYAALGGEIQGMFEDDVETDGAGNELHPGNYDDLSREEEEFNTFLEPRLKFYTLESAELFIREVRTQYEMTGRLTVNDINDICVKRPIYPIEMLNLFGWKLRLGYAPKFLITSDPKKTEFFVTIFEQPVNLNI